MVGVPFDLGTTNRSGTRLGPRAIREESSLAGEFPEGLWPWDHDVRERFRIVDLGDIGFSIPSVDSMLSQVTARASALAAAGISVLGLGGDHLVAYPLLRAQAEHHGPLSLVHLDAHSDTWPDDGNVNHGSMFRRAADEGLVDPARSVQIGMRTPNETYGFNVIHADELFSLGVDAVVARCHEIVGDRPTYLTVDIDFLDPAYAPGTGTPVIGGPTTWEARRLLLGLDGLDIVAADLVEVAPPYDHSGDHGPGRGHARHRRAPPAGCRPHGSGRPGLTAAVRPRRSGASMMRRWTPWPAWSSTPTIPPPDWRTSCGAPSRS